MKKTFSLIPVCVVVSCLFFAPNVISQTDTSESPKLETGQKLFREGKYVDAETLLKKIVKANPADAIAWYYLGSAFVMQKEYKEATKAFEAALKLQPNSAPVATSLANVLLLRHKYKDASPYAQRAVTLNPNSAEAHYIFGMIKFHLGDKVVALAEADRAIGLDKNFANAYLLKSQALVQFSGDVLVRQRPNSLSAGNRYRDAATALANYLQLAPVTADTAWWKAQLDSLNFHLSMGTKEERERNNVYSNKEVTTKVRLLSKPEPIYTDVARKNQVEGTVVLRALFASDGIVKYIVVLWGLPDGLTWQSVNAAKQIKFEPAKLNGQPVSMFINLEYNFHVF